MVAEQLREQHPPRRLNKPRNPGVAARSVSLSAVAPTPDSLPPQILQRPELARHHESGKKFLFGVMFNSIE